MRDFIREKIRVTAKKLLDFSLLSAEQLGGFKIKECGYKESENCPDMSAVSETVSFGDIIKGEDTHFWLYKKIKTPMKKSPYERMFFSLEANSGAQWIIYLNGELIRNFDKFHAEAELEADKEYDVYLYYYANTRDLENTGGFTQFLPLLKVIDQRAESLYYDINVPYESLELLGERSEEAIITQNCLEYACNLIDMRKPGSEEFFASVKAAAEYLKKEYYEKECGRGDVTISCIGHSHIDVAWRWPLKQTEEKVQRTFSNALRLMEEYDEYIFTASQIPLFKYAKKYMPHLYEKLKQKALKGQFDPEGAMYVEADCNLASGESLVRQIMFGKKFYKEEFGVDSHILWLPDVFGYSCALPQILKKSGVNRFVTSKISWNETNTMPYDAFMWQGIDGSEIFTTFITAQEYKNGEKYNRTVYAGRLKPSQVLGTRDRFQQKDYSKNGGLLPFGFGDGGGGSTRWMMENCKRLKYGIPGLPKVKIRKLEEYLNILYSDFEESAKKFCEMPKWVGELYLELHRGTLTSVARNKKNNRESEFLLQTAEQISILSQKVFGKEYPMETLNTCWEKVLLNQFHDIIPGSSIEEVYEDSDKDYAEIFEKGGAILENALKNIAENTENGGTLIYNPNSFEGDGYAKIGGKTAYIKNVPSLGWTVLENADFTNNIKVYENKIENKFYVISFDENGNIFSIYDKEAERQVIKEGYLANQIEAFEDYPFDIENLDNWEITDFYKQKKWNVDDIKSIEPIFDGARAGFKIVKSFLNSEIIQNVWVYENSRRIDFETEIDWKESHILLKAAFPINVHASKASYETQFGYIERPTHKNTSWDAAKFEVCAHKYADISEDDYGAAIINNCKYGHSAEGTTLKLTLLKCGTYPYKTDNEKHSFTYSFMPHMGNHKEGGVVLESYKLNRPLMAMPAKGGGNLSNEFSLVKCNKENIIIETVKKAENGEGAVIRMYDAFGRSGKVTLSLGFDAKEAYLCDLMENKLEKLSISGGKVEVNASAFEIVTLVVE